ncbi:DUF3046 domain-containing protein [Amnibacterium flavum]|uniref:DUF3046 domain-containing protein n=1 Tax=Amnibacterium flavum TaxID=2173173 RepID=A0A2V1HRC5_9MICO|nr:DUF3046 domain-containing protein [Amnibacterium flavum]PVZ93520.1 DUF3046 domain-containing protein [Amnibacterium flavum]
MRLSEFRFAVAEEFGDAHGRALVRELTLGDLGGLTAEEGIAAGRAVSDVWAALCRETGIPRDRWHGRGRPDPS